jgi:hypothetical protein
MVSEGLYVIYCIVFFVGTNEPDISNLNVVSEEDNETVFVFTNVKDNPAIAYGISTVKTSDNVIWRVPVIFADFGIPKPQTRFSIGILFPKFPQSTFGNDSHQTNVAN